MMVWTATLVDSASGSTSASVDPMSVGLLQTHGPYSPSMLRERAPRKMVIPEAADDCFPNLATAKLFPPLTMLMEVPTELRGVTSQTGRLQLVKLSGGGSGGSVVTLEKHHSTQSTGASSSLPPADPKRTDPSEISDMWVY